MHQVLIVGGSEEDRKAYKKVVEEQPLLTVMASVPSFAEALTILAEHRNMLVLLEGEIDELVSFFQLLRAQQEEEPIVIALAPAGTAKNAERVMKLGVFDYLVLPVQPDRLNMALESYVKWRKVTDGKAVLSQQWLDQTRAKLILDRVDAPDKKGIQKRTLQYLFQTLQQSEEPLNVAQLAESTNLSVPTISRYTRYLLKTEQITYELQYQAAGRPVKLFRLKEKVLQ